jgi:hypothetical protein
MIGIITVDVPNPVAVPIPEAISVNKQSSSVCTMHFFPLCQRPNSLTAMTNNSGFYFSGFLETCTYVVEMMTHLEKHCYINRNVRMKIKLAKTCIFLP